MYVQEKPIAARMRMRRIAGSKRGEMGEYSFANMDGVGKGKGKKGNAPCGGIPDGRPAAEKASASCGNVMGRGESYRAETGNPHRILPRMGILFLRRWIKMK